MITAIDASVIWAVLNNEDGSDEWVETLLDAASGGTLIISPVAFAEIAPANPSAESLLDFLDGLSICYDEIKPTTAHLAGETFKQYRKAGGPRQHLIPDFMIAAHAQVQADQLATIDRGYTRIWFPELRVLS